MNKKSAQKTTVPKKPSKRTDAKRIPRSRSAVPALRGYYYQLLWSALRWAQLERDTILMIEGEEDIDRDRKIRRSAPEHLAEQIKLREGSVVSTFDIRSVIGNFIVGFRKAEASGVAFRGILRTTSRSPKTRQPDIRKWLTGERRNHSKLASALRKRIPDRSADVDAMVKEKSLKRFCDAIEWCWADQGIAEVEGALATALAPFACGEAHVEILKANVVHEVLRRATSSPAAERRLNRQEFDEFVSDFALDRGPVFHGSSPGIALAIATSETHSVAALVRTNSTEALAAQLKKSDELAAARAAVIPVITAEDLMRADVVAYASVAPSTKNGRRVAIRDVLRHARHRWALDGVRVARTVLNSQLPRQLGRLKDPPQTEFERVDDADPLLRIAMAVAEATLERVIGSASARNDVAGKLRWVHLIAEREYWTEDSDPLFLKL
jgi:hypothetical protein